MIVLSPDTTAPDSVKEFRQFCRQMTAQSSFPVIEKITAPGALFGHNGFSLGDQNYLAYALAGCEALDIKVSENFRLTLPNRLYGDDQDVLNPNLVIPTDALLIPYLFDPPESEKEKYINAPLDSVHRISPRHFDPDSWYQMAKRWGTKIIIPFALRHEIGPKHFLEPKGESSIYEAIDTAVIICLKGQYRPLDMLVRKDLLAHLTRR